MREPDKPVLQRVRRLIDATRGYPQLEPIAKVAFAALLVAAVVFAVFLLVR